jgi:peptidoglycan pentaglycine glycine transferase (the first glycine)
MVLAYGTEGFFWQSAALYDYLGTRVNQYLQWQGMQWCMERGCTVYDMGGVFESRELDEDGRIVYHPIDPEKMEPEEQGLYNYKMGYGGALVRYIGAFDFPYNRPAYLLYRKLGPLQARGSDLLHTLQNRLQAILRRAA